MCHSQKKVLLRVYSVGKQAVRATSPLEIPNHKYPLTPTWQQNAPIHIILVVYFALLISYARVSHEEWNYFSIERIRMLVSTNESLRLVGSYIDNPRQAQVFL